MERLQTVEDSTELLHSEITEQIIGAAFGVYRVLGFGESVSASVGG
jgi:hypothetical protein